MPVLIANVTAVAFGATVTDTGTVSPVRPVLLRLTTAPPGPAAFDSVTVHVPLALAPNVVGLHCSEDTTVVVTKLMFALWDVPPYEAVTDPFWSALTAPVPIVNVAAGVFAATVTDAGTVSPVRPVLLRLTTTPPDPAAFDSVTVHVPLAFDPRVVGLHCSDDTTGAAARVRFTLREVPPYEAVTDPFWSVPTAPVLMANVAAGVFAATITDAGTVSPVRPMLLRLTTAPPGPAAFDSVTVHVPLAFDPNVVGLHCSEERTAGATKDIEDERGSPLYAAVTIAF